MNPTIMNLTHHDFPLGENFFVANSLYPRMLLMSPYGKLLVACPGFGSTVELEDFLHDWAIRFYDEDGEPGKYGTEATFYGVQFEVE